MALVLEITQAVGLEVTYEYDVMVFVSHNIFIYVFTNQGEKINLYFNQDCEKTAEEKFGKDLISNAKGKGIISLKKGHYRLFEADRENISIEFIDA